MRFIILGDDRASASFNRFAKQVDSANKAVDRNNAALRSQGKAAAEAEGGILGLIGAVSGFGDASTAASSKSSVFAKVLAGINLATGVLEPALAGVAVAAGAAAGAFAAAAAGAGAYGIALKPVLTQVSDLMTAQKAAATGGKAAQQKYQQMLKATPPLIVAFTKEVQAAQEAYKTWANSLAGATLAPLQTALSQVRPVLHAIRPLVLAASGAFETLVTQLSRKIEAGGLQRVVQTLLPHVRATILDLGHAFGNVAAGIWGVVKAFLPMAGTITGGVEKLTEKFKQWGQSLPSHTGFQSLMTMFRTQTPLAVGVLKNLAVIIKNVAAATVGLASPANSKALLQILTPLTQIIAKLSQNQALVRFVLYALLLNSALKKIGLGFTAASAGLSGFIGSGRGITNLVRGLRSAEAAADASTGAMGTFGGTLVKLWQWFSKTTVGLKLITAAQWLWNIAMEANPIGLIVTALAALGVAFYLAWTKSATFRKILIAVWKDIWNVTSQVVRNVVHAAGNFWHALVTAFNTVRTWVKRNWPWLLGALTGPIGLAIVWIIRHWRGLVSTISGLFASFRRSVANVWDAIWRNTVTRVRNGIDTVIGWVRTLPGRAIRALMGLGTSLYNFAHQAFTKFWNGMKNVAGTIWGWLTSWVQRLPGWLKKLLHISSPSGVFYDIGKQMMLGLFHGIKDHAKKARSAAVGAVGGINYKPGAGVAQWGPLVRRALLMEGLNPLLAARVMYQMQTESGGNPNAINLWDSNAAAGTPSKGLLQVIGPTFAAYHWPGTSWNIYNPLANIAAAINYARHRYGPTLMSGGMGMGSGHGYALGSWNVPQTGPAIIHSGEMVLPARLAGAVRRAAGTAPTTVVYNVNVAVPLAANRASVGREVVHAIQEYEKSSGTRWRR
jgi:SLT domain-containing protein/phage-related protein